MHIKRWFLFTLIRTFLRPFWYREALSHSWRLRDDLTEKLKAVNKEKEGLEDTVSQLQKEVTRTRTEVDRLRDESIRDPLTRLYNRRAIEHIVYAEILALQRSRTPFTLSVVVIDIDYFKRVNDTHGHAVGDQVLKRFAALIQLRCQRSSDQFHLFRFGGEEFVLICFSPPMNTARFADKLREAIEQDPELNLATTGQVTASFGVSAAFDTSLEPGLILTQALEGADRALYASKSSGRNQVRIE